MKKYFIVYKTTNLLNKKFYIGVHNTNDINDNYLGSGKILKLAIQKYGADNFKREILKIFNNKDDAYIYEKELVDNFLVENNECYNVKEGGCGGWDYVNNSPEIREKSSKNRTGENNGMYGRLHTQESKRKISDNRKGKNTGPQSKTHIENKRLSKCKKYRVVDPEGIEYIVTDLVRFCEKNDLLYKTMSKLPRNGREPKRGKCTGWKCYFI